MKRKILSLHGLIVLTAVGVVALLSGCARPMSMEERTAYEAENAARLATVDAEQRSPNASARKLVKTAEITIRVRDTQATARGLEEMAKGFGGYVASASASRRDDAFFIVITLRVSAERLDEALARVRELAERVEAESSRAEDVSEEYVDLDARLRTLRATEAELLQLLAQAKDRQQKLEDVMAVYQRLTEMRSAIEQLQGKMQALDKQVALSAVTISLWPTEAARPIAGGAWHPSETVRSSVRALVAGLKGLADVVIALVIVVLPIAMLIVVPLFGVVRLIRRRRRARKAGTT